MLDYLLPGSFGQLYRKGYKIVTNSDNFWMLVIPTGRGYLIICELFGVDIFQNVIIRNTIYHTEIKNQTHYYYKKINGGVINGW